MAETSKNKIYYNDDENCMANVLTDMKKMAESTDKAIENSKYNDAQIKKDISDAKKEQALKDTEQDNKIIELQNEKAKLETELKEAQEDFYQNSIRGQASGEYIHVEDSSNCRARIGIGGNSEQKMRSGKNYLNTLAKYKAGEKVTVDGITYIFNEDGSITCNGTATADSVLTFSSNLQTINGSGKKIVGMITGTQVPAKLSILAYTSDWSKNTFELLSSVNKNITINMQENIDYTIFRIIAYKGTTLNNQTIYYQILDTSVNDLTYEQYGASPSPDYTSPVVAVGSNVNEFDIDTVKDGFLNEKTGEIISNNSWKCSDFIEILNKTYTFGWESSSDYFQVTVCYYDENKKFISGKSYGLRGTFNNTFEVVSNAKYMKIAYSVSVRGELVTREKIKLEKGTVATPWSPYGMGSVGIDVVNKNLLNIANTEKTTKGGITYSIKNGILKLDGTATASFDIQLSKNIKIKKGKYTHSSSYIQPGLYISFNNLGYTIISAQVGKKRTFEITEDTTYKSYFIWIDKGTVLNNVEIKLQLEAGTTVRDFVEHQSQTAIMPIQQEMLEGDTFDYDNEEEVHTWGKLVLNGTEKIGISGASTDEILAVVYDINNAIDGFGYSNCFLYSSQVALNKLNVYNNGKNLRVCVDKSKFVDLESFKSKIIELYNEGTPVMIYYKLQTPTRLTFTDEQKAVAKELNNARTYKNVTNITTDSKAILSLDYAKDQETENQKMQNEIDEIKQLLSTTQTSALLLDNMQTDIESEVE